jgi:hypothetical protein
MNGAVGKQICGSPHAGRGPVNLDAAEEALELRDLVRHLAILHGDPERFHILKDEVAQRLGKLARRLGAAPATPSSLADRRAAMARALEPALLRKGPSRR